MKVRSCALCQRFPISTGAEHAFRAISRNSTKRVFPACSTPPFCGRESAVPHVPLVPAKNKKWQLVNFLLKRQHGAARTPLQ